MFVPTISSSFTPTASRTAVVLMMLLLLSVCLPLVAAPGATVPAVADIDWGRLPFEFIPNRGQLDPAVQMQAQANSGTVSFQAQEVVLHQRNRDQVAVQFINARSDARIVGGEQLAGIVNDFRGSDPARWRTNIPTFAAVTYQHLYNGIDLRYDGHEGALKGTYFVQPHIDPSVIRWRYNDAEHVEINADTGDLHVLVQDGTRLTEQAPVAWQEHMGTRVPVDARFTLVDGAIGFALGTYDRAQTLIIDPTLIYSTYLGGGATDVGTAIAVDDQGNTYVAGETSSANFPTTGAYQGQRNGDSTDAFITKLNSTGTARLYSTYLGGAGEDFAQGIAVDELGHVYLTGYTSSRDFPTQAPYQADIAGGSDVFVTKLSSTGNALIFSTYIGGSGNENEAATTAGIALKNGEVYIAGSTASSDFPTLGAAQGNFGGGTDGFMAKFSANGSSLHYATFVGGAADDRATAIAVDAGGHAYVTGDTFSLDLPIVNALQSQNGREGNDDAFFGKLNPDGSAFTSLSYWGGDGNEQGYGIAVDRNGNIYLAGQTMNSTNFPVVGRIQRLHGEGTAYLSKIAPSGRAILYSVTFGGIARSAVFGLALGPDDSVYLSGSTRSTNFPTWNPVQGTLAGVADAFVLRVDPQGCSAIGSTLLGGSAIENENHNVGAIAVDRSGNAYVTGVTYSTDFPVKNALQGSTATAPDAFVAKLALNGDVACPIRIPIVMR